MVMSCFRFYHKHVTPDEEIAVLRTLFYTLTIIAYMVTTCKKTEKKVAFIYNAHKRPR